VLCAQSMEKRKLQCPTAKYVMSAFAWKIALSCITRNSITEVMTIILLHLHSFKIPLQKFLKNRIISLRIMFFLNQWLQF
jgi:hypothetical protein